MSAFSALNEPLGRFRTDLVVEPQKKDGVAGAYRVTDPVSNISHVMTEIEYAVATCMNGQRTATDVARHAARLGHPVQVEHVERFHRELEGMSFVWRDQPPTGAGVAAPGAGTHREDAKRFIEEAKAELAQGRIVAARDLLDAAIQIDRAATGLPAQPPASASPSGPPNPNETLGPVLDYLKWNVPAPPPVSAITAPKPTSNAPSMVNAPSVSSTAPPALFEPDGKTGRWQPPSAAELAPLPSIDINMSDGSDTGLNPKPTPTTTQMPPVSLAAGEPPRRVPGWIAAALVLVAMMAAGTMAVDRGWIPLPEVEHAELTFDPPKGDAAPVDAMPPPSPNPAATSSTAATTTTTATATATTTATTTTTLPTAPPPPVEAVVATETANAQAMREGDTRVLAPARGKFKRALVQSGLKVKTGQRLAILVDAAGNEKVVISPAAGIFEATAALGKTIAKGEDVGVIHPF